jgi:hypothetical protein
MSVLTRPQTAPAFMSKRERPALVQHNDDFLKRLEAVEENPEAAALVMPLVTTNRVVHAQPDEAIEREHSGDATGNPGAEGRRAKKHEVSRHRRVYKVRRSSTHDHRVCVLALLSVCSGRERFAPHPRPRSSRALRRWAQPSA